jgi:molybdenum cofactor cytidylyltransferase
MDAADKKIGLVILAAGESSRLGFYPKQLLEFKGKTLIRHAAENALSSKADLVSVVLGAQAESLKAGIEDLAVEIVINENWPDGMASSLQKGLHKLLAIEPDLSALCITLCDQPLVDSGIIDRLIETFQTGDSLIVASAYAETSGVPAVFSSRLFDELLALESSQGAKKVIVKHLDRVKKIPVPEAFYDIDTRQDFAEFLEKNPD